VLPRTAEQRTALQGSDFIVPERPVDGPTLVQLADFVVSAGGTMNREAVALGVPAFTPFAGRLGAVDLRLIADGRLNRIERPDQVDVVKRDRSLAPPLRDPEMLLDAILAIAR
jgi:predicted glycosyltransferase